MFCPWPTECILVLPSQGNPCWRIQCSESWFTCYCKCLFMKLQSVKKQCPVAPDKCLNTSDKRKTKGSFHLSELAGQAVARPVSLKMKYAFSKSFCWKTSSLMHTIILWFDWSGWKVLIESEIILTGMVWLICWTNGKHPEFTIPCMKCLLLSLF